MFAFRVSQHKWAFSLLSQLYFNVNKSHTSVLKPFSDVKNLENDPIELKSEVALGNPTAKEIKKRSPAGRRIGKKLWKKIQVLDEVGINVQQYPQLLGIKSENLVRNIKLLREINLEEDAIVEMLMSHPALILKCYKACKRDMRYTSNHRIHYLCEKLMVSQKDFCAQLYKYRFALSLSFKRIRKVMTVLLDHGVSPSFIFSDFWILQFKPDAIAARLSLVKDVEVDPLRPWMGRCENLVFEGFLNRATAKHELLGELSPEEYISQRLNCDAKEMKRILDTEPQLRRTNVVKIKKILDFLFSNGFSASEILSVLPRVSKRRVETLHARMLEMQQEKIPPSLYVVCKSQREYQGYINKWKNRGL